MGIITEQWRKIQHCKNKKFEPTRAGSACLLFQHLAGRFLCIWSQSRLYNKTFGGKNVWTYLILYWVMWPSIISTRTIPSHVNDLPPVPNPAGPFHSPPSMVKGLPVLQSLHSWSHSLVPFHVTFPMLATVPSALHYSVYLFSLISWTVRKNSITQCKVFFVVFMILTFTLHTSAIISSNLHKYPVSCT